MDMEKYIIFSDIVHMKILSVSHMRGNVQYAFICKSLIAVFNDAD